MKQFLVSLVTCAMAAGSVSCGQEVRWLDSVDFEFNGRQGAITLHGSGSSTCKPDTIWHTYANGVLDVSISEPLRLVCTDDLRPWELRDEFTTGGEPIFEVVGTSYYVSAGELILRDGPDVLLQFDRPQRRAVFHGLGVVDSESAVPTDVSAAGTTVVGYAASTTDLGVIQTQAFEWNPGRNVRMFGELGVDPNSRAHGVSSSGDVIVGSIDGQFEEAVVWKENVATRLGAVEEPPFNAAHAVSADGSVIVGADVFTGPTIGGIRVENGFRWTAGNGMELIPALAPRMNSQLVDVSADGTKAVGTSIPNFFNQDRTSEPIVWSEALGTVGIGHIEVDHPAAIVSSSGEAISADGNTVVGTTRVFTQDDDFPARPAVAFAWHEPLGMQDLGFIPGRLFRGTEAVDVSGDGSTIVGHNRYGIPSPDDREIIGERTIPYLWDQQKGMRTLHDVVANERGLLFSGDLDGWQLETVSAISEDGLTIVGTGINPAGQTEAWRIVLSHRALPGDANLDGRFDSQDLVLVFQGGEYEDLDDNNSAWMTGDWSEDGDFDSSDLVLAFQQGNYEDQPAAASVPEPASLFLLAIIIGGLIGVLRSCRKQQACTAPHVGNAGGLTCGSSALRNSM